MIRNAAAVVFLTLFILIVGPVMMLYAVLTRSKEALYHVCLGGVLVSYRILGIRARAEGRENIPAGPCVYAANHTSFIDPPAIMKCIPGRIGILIKKEIFSVPIVGPAFRLGQFVPVERAKREEAAGSVDLAAEYLKQGLSFLIYPEGTRSPDGRLGTFKKGGFALPIRAGVPVVPVACIGAHRIMAKNSLRVRPGEIVVRFCPPIDAAAYTVEQRGKLAERVHTAIAEALPPDQQPKGAIVDGN
jgi:1-acyl-sn-glycerol-3-phosphate acyltransferase